MKKNLSPRLLAIVSIALSLSTKAEVRLPAILGSHMVLQQNTEVQLWGWSDPGEKIEVRTGWDTTAYRTTGDPGAKWSLKIKTPAAGGPYSITINGHNKIVLDDVLIGEVWLGSGQSNMEMHFNWGVKQYTAEMDSATNKSIRLFQIPRLSADYPQDDTKGRWVVLSPEAAKTFSLVALFFGQKLNKELGVPVGLIHSSWGGTPAEVWVPADSIKANASLTQAATKLNPTKWWPIAPGATYNAMIHPITRYTIAGWLWYQGEANVGADANYRQLLPALIATWRKAWGKDLPFYYAQIAPWSGYGTSNSSALLREAQAAAQSVPNTGMVVTHDLVHDIKDIHPHNKKDVGLRLTNYALAQTYGQVGIAYKSPQYARLQVEKDRAVIYFEGVTNGLVSKGGAPTEFYIAGEDRQFVKANARIAGNTMLVWSKDVKKPVAVRYGFSSAAMPNLYNKEGLPVAIFRTDNWNDVPTITSVEGPKSQ